MYKLLKMVTGEPLQILREDTELMSIKFYSQTLWTTLNVSLLDKKLGEAFIFAMQGRDATWSSVDDPTPLRPAPKSEATNRLPFLSIKRKTWQSLANRPDGPETDPEHRPFSDLPLPDHLVDQRCVVFLVSYFFFFASFHSVPP